MLDKAMKYAIQCHKDTNHLYDGKSYSHHLSMVVGTANDFIHLIPQEDWQDVLAACWCHDLQEDCRETYNNVKAATNERVAEIVYAVTNEKGKTRKDRANEKYYSGIRAVQYADFVKICDRIANYEYSRSTGSGMYKKYKSELPDFYLHLRSEKYNEMWLRLT